MGTQVSARSAGMNQSVVLGQLVANPESRELPSGSIAMSFALTVRSPGLKTTSVPLVWYDPPKRVAKWTVGDNLVAVGSVVRRFYRGGSGLGSSTEVVVERAELATHASRSAAVLHHALRDLGACVESLVGNG